MEIILFRDNITNKTHSNFYLEYGHNVSKLLVGYVGTKKYMIFYTYSYLKLSKKDSLVCFFYFYQWACLCSFTRL